VGQYVSDTEITFTGTPWYEIKLLHSDGYTVETIESGSTFLLPCDYTMSSFTDATGAPGIIKCLAPANLMLATPYTTICAGQTVTLAASATGAASYSLDGSTWQAEDAFEVAPSSTTHYTLYAQTEDGCVTSVADAAVVTVNPLPAILLSSGDASQTVNQGTGITTIVYTATDATGISSSSSFPDGVSGIYSSGSYTISGTPTVNGIFNYTVTTANGNGCTNVTASGTITVTQPQGSCTYTEPAVVGTFASFDLNSSASTYVSLIDERDDKVYPVVKIGDRWIMARNLNYQGTTNGNPSTTFTLTWQANANTPYTSYSNGAVFVSYFWCPGAGLTSTRASCDVWGALYSWEAAMMLDGKWTSSAHSSSTWSDIGCVNNNCGRSDNETVAGGRGICPPNWHVPTDAEWGDIFNEMETGTKNHDISWNFGGTNAGAHAKSKCMADNGSSATQITDTQANWPYINDDSVLGTDDYNFRALPAGYRYYTGSSFDNRGYYAIFWSSTVYNSSAAMNRDITYNLAGVARNPDSRAYGFTIRCIRD
jgi:uncharacterized protein (TIGR02145 family)